MHRLRSLTTVVIGAALLGAACSGDVEPVGVRRIEVAALWTGTEQERFLAVLDAFTARTGVTVEYTHLDPADVSAAIDDRIENSSQPHVAMLPQPGLLRQLADCGQLEPLPIEAQQEVDENYPSPELKDPGMFDGQMYGVWFKAANKSTVWFDTSAFRTNDITPPRTWAQFLLDAERLAERRRLAPVSIGAADGWVLTDWFENIYLQVAGPEKYDQLARHAIPWTHVSVIESLTVLAELWRRDDLIVGGRSGALGTSYPKSVKQVFEDHEGVIVYEGDFVASLIRHGASARLGERARFFAFPKQHRRALRSVIAAGDVAVMMRDSEEARQLMQFLADPVAGQTWARLGAFISPNVNVGLDTYTTTDAGVSRRSATALHTAPILRFDLSDQLPAPMGSTEGTGMRKSLQEFLADPTDAAGTARRLESRAEGADNEAACPGGEVTSGG